MPCSAAGVQKAMTLVKYSQPYEVTEHELPIPVGTEVLIRTTYAGLCHSELHMWEGKFNLGGGQSLDSSEDQLPCVLGHEPAGIVEAVGPGVTEFAVGDAVFGITFFGAYSSRLLVPASQCRKTPKALSDAEAAALAASLAEWDLEDESAGHSSLLSLIHI